MSYGNFSIWWDLQNGKTVEECVCELKVWYPEFSKRRAKHIVETIRDYGLEEPINWDVIDVY